MLSQMVRGTFVLRGLLLLAAAAAVVFGTLPVQAAQEKIKFRFILFPEVSVVDTEPAALICLLNEGDENSLEVDADPDKTDKVTLSFPVGPNSSDLIAVDDAEDLQCTSQPDGWTCSVELDDMVEPPVAMVTFEPSGGFVVARCMASRFVALVRSSQRLARTVRVSRIVRLRVPYFAWPSWTCYRYLCESLSLSGSLADFAACSASQSRSMPSNEDERQNRRRVRGLLQPGIELVIWVLWQLEVRQMGMAVAPTFPEIAVWDRSAVGARKQNSVDRNDLVGQLETRLRRLPNQRVVAWAAGGP